jgi:tungstate transport system substrate-binding protein
MVSGWGLVAPGGRAEAAERFITVASTTSTESSGLFSAILPQFEARTGIEVRVVAVGTGQAIRLAERGDADVLLVHHRPSEDRFVAEGWGVERHALMYNDFVVVGPASDPAEIRGSATAAAAFEQIARREAAFASRGDDSGTHKAEVHQWKKAGTDPSAASGTWYRETGSGMGATLNTAAAMGAYALCDRGTWLAFHNREDLEILVEGDPELRNPYGVILVNAERHPHVKRADAQAFIDWLTTSGGQDAIGGFRVGGERLFIPDASQPPKRADEKADP